MPESVSPQKTPYGIDLQPGTYWRCACGKSKNQPVQLTVTEPATYWLCGCKHSNNQPRLTAAI